MPAERGGGVSEDVGRRLETACCQTMLDRDLVRERERVVVPGAARAQGGLVGVLDYPAAAGGVEPVEHHAVLVALRPGGVYGASSHAEALGAQAGRPRGP